MRLLMAIVVIYSHSFALLGLPQPEILGIDIGTVAVRVFFALSGYLITRSWARDPSLRDFTAKRALRLLPALAVAILYGKAALVYTGGFPHTVSPYVNGSLWTIPWEITCYIACAGAGLLGLLRADRFRLFFAGCWIVVIAQLTKTGPDPHGLVWLLLYFLTGSFMAVYETDLPIRTLGRVSGVILAAGGLVEWLAPAIVVTKVEAFLIPPFVLSMLWQIGMTLGISFLALYLGKHTRVTIPVRQDYSYGLYVFAWPTQQMLINAGVLSKWSEPDLLFLVSLTAVLPLAVMSWHLVEKRALRLRDLRFKAAAKPRIWRMDSPGARALAGFRGIAAARRNAVAGRIAKAVAWVKLAPAWAVSLDQKSGVAVGFIAFCLGATARVAVGAGFQGFPFVTFFPAVLITALCGGWVCAAFFAAIELYVAYWFFSASAGAWSLGSSNSDQIGFMFDGLTIALEIGFVSGLRNALREALAASRSRPERDQDQGLPSRMLRQAGPSPHPR